MAHRTVTAFIIALSLIICACSSQRTVNGWYPISEYPDNTITGKPLATVNELGDIVMLRDTFIIANDTVTRLLIQGRVKPDKRQQWADDTEQLIGHRIGFVYNDTVVTAPQINSRIESGSFQITNPDTTLIKKIYNSIRNK